MVVYTLKQRWKILRHYFFFFLPKKIVFSDELHFDLGGYVNRQNYRIWGTENPHAYIEKPKHSKRVTVWCGLWSRDRIGPFFFENEQGETITVNGNRYRACWTNFCSQKLIRRILATFAFNSTALYATQPKLHSMFWALFLKIALSAAELMSFGELGAAFWHLWTIICGYADKPETFDALKDNIRVAIGVLKNWTDRVGYCMVSRGSHLNEIIFHFLKDYTFK